MLRVWGYRELEDREIDEAGDLLPGRFVAFVGNRPAGSAGYSLAASDRAADESALSDAPRRVLVKVLAGGQWTFAATRPEPILRGVAGCGGVGGGLDTVDHGRSRSHRQRSVRRNVQVHLLRLPPRGRIDEAPVPVPVVSQPILGEAGG